MIIRQNLALNYPQRLICHKIPANQPKSLVYLNNSLFSIARNFSYSIVRLGFMINKERKKYIYMYIRNFDKL